MENTKLIFETGETEYRGRNIVGAGRYRIMERLGEGGGGEVYRAYDLHMDREVAIKWGKGEKGRAGREAEVLKRLKHPAIPTIFDVVEENGKTGIVMEYIQGKSLLEILEEGMLPEKTAVEIGIKTAECLAYLHSLPEKIIYRDLKPDNLLVDRQGELRLIDFDAAFREDTKEYQCMGTYGYSAPEQYVPGVKADERSDVYAFGTTMYHLLSGRNPSKPPYLFYGIRECNPLVSEELEEIVMKCMEENREKRISGMEEILEELKNYREGSAGKRFKRNKAKRRKYRIREEKQILLTEKRSGRLFLGILLLSIMAGKGSLRAMSLNAAQSMETAVQDAGACDKKELILPLVTYNGAREKIIIRDGKMYETEKDFHMAIPFSELMKEEGIRITVICTDIQSGVSRKREIWVKGKEDKEGYTSANGIN